MELTQQLIRLGLTASECNVYLFLLQSGNTTPPIVSRETKIARTNCYHVLTSLVEKRLIEERPDGQRKAYAARHPSSLIEMIREQEKGATALLPDLEMLYTPEANKPRVTFFKGWDEIRKLFYEALGASEIFFVNKSADFEAATGALYSYFTNEIAQRGIHYRELSTDSLVHVSRETKEVLNQLPLNPADAMILLWGTQIALINAQEPTFATVVNNKTISGTFYRLFGALKNL